MQEITHVIHLRPLDTDQSAKRSKGRKGTQRSLANNQTPYLLQGLSYNQSNEQTTIGDDTKVPGALARSLANSTTAERTILLHASIVGSIISSLFRSA